MLWLLVTLVTMTKLDTHSVDILFISDFGIDRIGFRAMEFKKWITCGDLQYACVSQFFHFGDFFLRLFNVYIMFENVAWVKIEFYFYVLAATLSLFTSTLITARYVGMLTIASLTESFCRMESVATNSPRSISVIIPLSLFRFSDTPPCSGMAWMRGWSVGICRKLILNVYRSSLIYLFLIQSPIWRYWTGNAFGRAFSNITFPYIYFSTTCFNFHKRNLT